MTDDGEEFVDEFDKRVASIWLVIALGATKSVEKTVLLAAEHAVNVSAGGIDVTVLALYLTLACAGTTALILWKTTDT